MKVTWDPKSKDEREFAAKIFRHAVEKEAKDGRHYHAKAFTAKRRRAAMSTFDPQAGGMILEM